MGVFSKDTSKLNKSKGSVTRAFRSKGDRLGWVSLKDAETVNLEKALSSGRVVSKKTNFEHLLVP